jgi:threonine dehydratase
LKTLPVFEDIVKARIRIAGKALVTPLLESPVINTRSGGRVLLKAESLQKTGSFKFRGASHFIARLDEQTRKQGVVAYSSGNHAQAVSAAAQQAGVPAVIVMPEDAPRVKIEGTRFYGAQIVFYNRLTQSREEIAATIAEESAAVLLPPYDHPFTMAGQGTVGLELVEQAAALDEALDAVLIPCSGGGLAAGCSIAMKAQSPHTAIYCVEPTGFDDTARSLAAGRRVFIEEPGGATICDALMLPTPGELTFPVLLANLQGGLVVTDTEVQQAMAIAFHHLKLVLEPGGAVALAAVLSGKLDCRGKTVGVVLSGGNVDTGMFCAALRNAEQLD